MTPLQFIARLRRQILFDEGGDAISSPSIGFSYLWEENDSNCIWKNADLLDFLNEARNEYYRIVGIPKDITLSIQANIMRYEMPIPILSIERILDSDGHPLAKITHDINDWESWPIRHESSHQIPPVSSYYEDLDVSAIRIVDTPQEDSVLTITVKSLPDELLWTDRNSDDDAIPPHHYAYLLHWAAHRAYLQHDADSFDREDAARHLSMFTLKVGNPVSAEDEEWRKNMANRRPRAKSNFM